mmetsp:Transcript_37195/g.42822  ORF Transcript_37195/g.42822 Transcript_37195/m.42822 type:complete len:131 (-) Transcript_37195:2001-2393(-)
MRQLYHPVIEVNFYKKKQHQSATLYTGDNDAIFGPSQWVVIQALTHKLHELNPEHDVVVILGYTRTSVLLVFSRSVKETTNVVPTKKKKHQVRPTPDQSPSSSSGMNREGEGREGNTVVYKQVYCESRDS